MSGGVAPGMRNQWQPARVSRNLSLPNVVAEGEMPFVITARFPNGAVAVCALERTVKINAWLMRSGDVTANTTDAKGPFGIFGHYRNLTLQMSGPLRDARILTQDLAGERAEEVTQRVRIDGDTIAIPGSRIDEVGTQAATPGDSSDPGLVLAGENR
jgi:hypothetical protein